MSPECPEQLLIALEPEAASIYCRKLRLHQVIDLSLQPILNGLDPDGARPFDSGFRQGSEGWGGAGGKVDSMFCFTPQRSWKQLWGCCTRGGGYISWQTGCLSVVWPHQLAVSCVFFQDSL